jgi:glycosyltransferase involved in cell wall biosynthesis
LITVVIPVHNRPIFVKRAIESVLNQTFSLHEIIVVDDGSDDKTPDILKTFQDKIKIITQKNLGVSSARNAGIKSAKFNWICFLDSDDCWREDKLEKQLAFHKLHSHILFSHTNEEWIRDARVIKQKKQHKKPSGFCFEENLNFCKIAPSTVMIKKSIFEELGYFDESLEVCEDFDMWLRVLKMYEVGLVKEVVATKFAGHKNQLSFKHHSMNRYRILALLKHSLQQEVKKEIEIKLDILLLGAKKHQNDELIEFCESIFKSLR